MMASFVRKLNVLRAYSMRNGPREIGGRFPPTSNVGFLQKTGAALSWQSSHPPAQSVIPLRPQELAVESRLAPRRFDYQLASNTGSGQEDIQETAFMRPTSLI
jgi:hypothetical protein